MWGSSLASDCWKMLAMESALPGSIRATMSVRCATVASFGKGLGEPASGGLEPRVRRASADGMSAAAGWPQRASGLYSPTRPRPGPRPMSGRTATRPLAHGPGRRPWSAPSGRATARPRSTSSPAGSRVELTGRDTTRLSPVAPVLGALLFGGRPGGCWARSRADRGMTRNAVPTWARAAL
ncbi:hypothetical protein GCM10009863_09760 [Streptomyces axinellae]|uniref:Uncharacterized protein n=1 Tax=Streptomyces axinellae TaxID=552788 RepID=A0ABN3PSJ0_9ACTN